MPTSWVDLSAQLIWTKGNERFFVMNFWRNFGWNFLIFLKNLLARNLLLLIFFIFLISTQCEQAPFCKLLFLNERARRSIGHLRFLWLQFQPQDSHNFFLIKKRYIITISLKPTKETFFLLLFWTPSNEPSFQSP